MPKRIPRLNIWMNGELVGRWLLKAGTHDYILQYDDAWVQGDHGRPLSLSLPLHPKEHRGPIVRNYFDNLLPDSEAIRRRIQARFRTDSTDPFDLLAEIGRDCVGAIQLLPEEAEAPDVRRLEATPLKDGDIERRLTAVLQPSSSAADDGSFRISIAGAQEKTALLRYHGEWLEPKGATPTTHIFKFPLGHLPRGIDMSTSVENEWLCNQILREYGVPVPTCEIAEFGPRKVLIVERFDRRFMDSGWFVRLPQEDLCQATGTPPALKYEADGGPGVRSIMDLLVGSSHPTDRLEFFRTQLLYWFLCAIDGHAKNFSLFLEPRNAFRLTPRYDVLSAYPVIGRGADMDPIQEVKMAMAVWGKGRHYKWERILKRHWQATAKDLGLGGEVDGILSEAVRQTPGVVAAVARKLPHTFPAATADSILHGLEQAAKRL